MSCACSRRSIIEEEHIREFVDALSAAAAEYEVPAAAGLNPPVRCREIATAASLHLRAMPAASLNTDVALGVAIPSRNARGRIARLTGRGRRHLVEPRISPADREIAGRGAGADRAARLAAQGGRGPADPPGADRGRDRRPDGLRLSRAASCAAMSATTPNGSAKLPAEPDAVRRCSARAIWRSPSTIRLTKERYQGIVPLEGDSLAEAAQSYLRPVRADPEPGAARGRQARRPLGRRRVAGPAFARGRGGARAAAYPARSSRLAARRGPRRVGRSRTS